MVELKGNPLLQKSKHDSQSELPLHRTPSIPHDDLGQRKKRKSLRAVLMSPMKKNVTEDQELYKERRQRLLEVEEQSMIDNSVKRSPGHSYPTVAPGRKSLIDMTASEDDPDDPRENPVERTVFRYSETHHGNRSSNHKQCYDSSKRMPSECELSFKKNRALRRWKKLRQYVLSGEALLTLRTVKDEDGNTQSLSAQYSSWVVNDHVFTLNQCLMAIVAWIAIAVIAFRTVFGGHNWSVIDCIYFSVVTFTTVGYGDLVPATPASKIFVMFYAASGIVWLSVVIGVLGSNIVEAQQMAIDRAKQQWKQEALDLFTLNPMLVRSKSFESVGGRSLCSIMGEKLSMKANDKRFTTRLLKFFRIKPTASARKITNFAILIAFVITLFGVTISFDPALRDMPIVSVPYFVAVTAVTCGYGDVVPKSQWGRLATSMFIPLIVATTAQWMKFIAKHIIDQRSKKFRRAMASRELSLEDFEMMDDDRDGNVTRAEFLEFMLLAMGKVDNRLITELREHFARIDTGQRGCLSKNGIIDNARKKLRKPKRKLELNRYKAQLLKHAAEANARAERLRLGGHCAVFNCLDNVESYDMQDNGYEHV